MSKQTDEQLKKRGLKRMVINVCLFWNPNQGWATEVQPKTHAESWKSMDCGGYADFAGRGEIECIVPLRAELG